MTEAKSIILDKLLDKYEASAHLRAPGKSSRRVLLDISKGGFPEYDYHDIRTKERYNRAFDVLAREEIIFVDWLNGKKSTAAKSIWLNLAHVDKAYQCAGRATPQQRAGTFAGLFRNVNERVSLGWIKEYCLQQAERLENTLRLSAFCRKGERHVDAVLKALISLERLEESISMRAFSILCYNDSKRFEREVRDDFLKICRAHAPAILEQPEKDELSWQEALQLLGIHVWPEYYEFAGKVVISAGGDQCDLGPISSIGVALPSHVALREIDFSFDTVRQVLFIENKTCHDEYVLKRRKDTELVVFHGGFPSAEKRKFFQKLFRSAAQGTRFLYWGDIDLGGFHMFTQLAQIMPPLQPWLMDGWVVEQFHKNGLARPKEYLGKIKAASAGNLFPLFQESIDQILEFGVTIEQEILLPHLNNLKNQAQDAAP